MCMYIYIYIYTHTYIHNNNLWYTARNRAMLWGWCSWASGCSSACRPPHREHIGTVGFEIHVCVYTCISLSLSIYIYIYIWTIRVFFLMCVYIYMYIERERDGLYIGAVRFDHIRASLSGPKMGQRKRVAWKADGKLTRLVNLVGSWHEKLVFLVTHFSLPIWSYPFRGRWMSSLKRSGLRGPGTILSWYFDVNIIIQKAAIIIIIIIIMFRYAIIS